MKLKKSKPTITPLQAALQNTPRIVALIDTFLLYFSGVGLVAFLYDIGFEHSQVEPWYLHYIYHFYFLVVFFCVGVRTAIVVKDGTWRPSLIFEGLLLSFMLMVLVARLFLSNQVTNSNNLLHFFDSEHPIYFIIFYVFIIELSKKTLLFYSSSLHPAQMFVLSFLFLIALGTFLLLLPQATTENISFIDALFTATSAVCVTGLITLDTATAFTPAGKVIILFLIQVGGLGIMTFASFFGIFFQGSSLKSALFMKDWLNEDNLGQITRTLFKIVSFTLGIELLGGLLLYWSLQGVSPEVLPDKLSFSFFHSVSAFCNAGFSTLSMGLFDPAIRFNYPLQLIITGLVILGGLGFPIVFNLTRYVRYKTLTQVDKLNPHRPLKHSTRVLNVNTLLGLITTVVLLVAGSIVYYFLEANNTLAEHTPGGKIVGAFFGAVTPRTAGFNTVDMAALTAPTVLLYLLLMWIGASPASVGGGIKTTTFSLALLNIVSLARGKDRVEAFGREIDQESIFKAFAIILLSLFVIGLAVFLITFFDPQLGLAAVAFECFSGFSTVGLSLGITPLLSPVSKVVMIITMFLGRVGTLTLIVGILRKVSSLRYRYPKETIIIT